MKSTSGFSNILVVTIALAVMVLIFVLFRFAQLEGEISQSSIDRVFNERTQSTSSIEE